jgi:hypothetical protein
MVFTLGLSRTKSNAHDSSAEERYGCCSLDGWLEGWLLLLDGEQ